MIDWVIFLPMLIMGLVSSAHCIGMCGGIMGALTVAIPASAHRKRWKMLLAYNAGRITSYGVMGVLVGLFSHQLINHGAASFLRIMAGSLLICMGLYLADWWRGLGYLEKMGRYLWVYLQPLGKHLLPVNNIYKALLLGTLWGWLPCGLIYSALALAMTQPSPLMASGAMLAFGFGTLPAVLVAGVATQQITRLLQKKQVRVGLALLVIFYGIWTISGGLGGHSHHNHSLTEPAMQEQDHSMMHHHHDI